MLGRQAISDDAFRTLAALLVAASGAYAFTDPSMVAALTRAGWSTPYGEITSAGEEAFVRAQRQRALDPVLQSARRPVALASFAA
jgi:hypothetical protein